MNKKQYSDEEAREILKRAIDYEEHDAFSYSSDELVALGREIGLSQAALVKAESSITTAPETPVDGNPRVADADFAKLEQRYHRQRMQELYLHFMIFGVIMALLVVLNFMAGMTFAWVIMVCLSWGGILLRQYLDLRGQEGAAYEKGFDAWLEKRKAQLHKRQQWAKRLQGE